MTNKKSPEDSLIIRAIANLNRALPEQERAIHIFDARPKLNAHGNRVKGGGFEDPANYKPTLCEVDFLDIDNIHAVRSCFNKMEALFHNPQIFNTSDGFKE